MPEGRLGGGSAPRAAGCATKARLADLADLLAVGDVVNVFLLLSYLLLCPLTSLVGFGCKVELLWVEGSPLTSRALAALLRRARRLGTYVRCGLGRPQRH